MKNYLFFNITLCFFFLNQALAIPKFDKIINSKEVALLPPPSNDDPCNATPLNVGTTCSFVNATNASATASTGVPAPGCAGYSGGDVWFTVIVPANGSLSVSMQASAMTDGGMALYSGTCSSLALIACDDNSGTGNMPEIYSSTLTPGATIWIRVWENGNNNNGSFRICATNPPTRPQCGGNRPAGNSCANAIPVCNFNGYCGNTSSTYAPPNTWTELTNSFSSCLSGASIENNSFVKFTANATSATFNVWVYNSQNNLGIQMFFFQSAGNCSGTVTCKGGYNNNILFPSPLAHPITASPLVPGQTYYLMFDGYAGDVCDYTIDPLTGVDILTVNTNPTSPTICLGSNITLSAIGGTTSAVYSWRVLPTGSSQASLNTTTGQTVIATPTANTTYQVVATTSTCNLTKSIDVQVITAPSAPIVPNQTFYCSGENASPLTAVGITGATINWYTTATGGTAQNSITPSTTNPSTTTYYVSQSLPCGESPRVPTNVVVYQSPVIPNQNQIICSGNSFSVSPVDAPSSGTIVPSGTTYTWTVSSNTNVTGYSDVTTGLGSISQTLTNNSNTSQQVVYTVTPTSGTTGNCIGTTFTITVTVTPRPTIQNEITSTCSGNVFSVTPSNTTIGNSIPSGTVYTWTVIPNANVSGLSDQAVGQTSISQTLTNLSSTIQNLTYNVASSNGLCAGSNFTVNVSLLNNTPVPSVISPISYCQNTTANPLTVSGLPGATYLWYTSPTGGTAGIATPPTPSTIVSGTTSYYVSQTISCGESNRTKIDVVVNPVASIPNQNATICSGTSFNISPANTPPSTIVPAGTIYTWTVLPNTNVSGYSNETIGQSAISQILTNLTNSIQTITYNVTPTTGTCTGSAFTIIVTINPKPQIDPQNTTICSGQTFTISPSSSIVPSGTTYVWTVSSNSNIIGQADVSSPQINISQTLANNTNITQFINYSVTPVAGNCTGSTFNVDVTVNPLPDIPDQSAIIWTGETFNVTPSNNPPTTLVPLGTSYTWTVAPNPNVSGYSNETVGQSSISQTLINNTNASQIVVYTVTPTSGTSGNCAGIPFFVTVTVNPKPLIPNQTGSICSGTIYTFTPVNNPPLTIVPTGTLFTWTVSSNSNITGQTNEIIGQPNFSQTLNNIGSSDETIIYTVTPTLPGSSSTTISSFTISITVYASSNVNVPSNLIACNGDNISTINFTSNPAGGTFNWTNSDNSIGLAASGNGTINGFNAVNATSSALTSIITVTPVVNGCNGVPGAFSITVKPSPKMVTPSGFAACNGNSTSIIQFSSIPAGGTFSWVNSNPGIGLNATGTNNIPSFTAINTTATVETSTIIVIPTVDGCVGASEDFVITVHPTPNVVVPSNYAVCNGINSPSFSFISIPSGGTFTWINDNPSIGLSASGNGNVPIFTASSNNSNATTANITVTPIVNTCIGIPSTYTITINPRLSLGNDLEIDSCYSSAVNLDLLYNTNNLNISWTLNSIPVRNTNRITISGNYRLIATNSNNCSDTAIVRVHILPKVIANAGQDTTAILGEPFQLNGSGGISFEWSPTNSLTSLSNIPNPTALLNHDQLFYLATEDVAGCKGFDTVFVKVYNGPEYYIPNSFTPNSDGLNDIFRAIPVGIANTEYFRIYDRYGKLIFQTNRWLRGWDGNYQGRKQPNGAYVWMIKGKDKFGKVIEKKGSVLLLR